MSWTINAVGKAPAVRKSVAKQFENNGSCAIPNEQSIHIAAFHLLQLILSAQDPATVVRVTVAGGQTYEKVSKREGLHNFLRLAVEPEHEFCD